MKFKKALMVVIIMGLAVLACGGGDLIDENLPATDVPSTAAPPTETPEGGGVEDGFFVLNLSDGDQAGLEERADEIYQKLVNSGGEVDRGALLDAYAELAQYERIGGEWRAIGPAPIEGVYLPQGRINGSGHVSGIVVDPDNSEVVYVAASVGGIWKTEDGGQSWRSLTDAQVPLIYGGLVMDPRDHQTLYGLLGEFYDQVASTYGFLANGIMRTRDGGETWELIGANEFNAATVTEVVFDNDGNLYASSGQVGLYTAPPDQPEFGIFKSSDGGDTWEQLVKCSDFGNCKPRESSGVTAYLGGFMDMAINSDGTLFASLCNVECYGTKLLRSTDGGSSWEELDYADALDNWQSENEVTIQYVDEAQEIPFVNGFRLAASQSDPNVLIAGGGLNWQDDKNNGGVWSWIIRSTDGGDSWEWMPEAGDYCTGTGNTDQCTYSNVLAIDPTDANNMYAGGSFSLEEETYNWVGVVRASNDGGDTWRDLTPPAEGSFMHPDMHSMGFDPNDPNVLWVGNDGGIYRTADATADPPEWVSLAEGMNTMLVIDVATHPSDPDYYIAGFQDNARAFTTDGGQSWEGAASGDGAYVAVDPFEPDIVYGSIYPPTIFERNDNGGQGDYSEWAPSSFDGGYTEGLDGSDNWMFYPPFTVDPNNEGVLYIISNRVYKSEDRAESWEPISDYLNASDYGSIQSIEVAKADSNVIYAGTTDGTLWVTTDGGGDWSEITDSNFPPRNITRIAADPTDATMG
jgi:photosystem II stability/assembly factor-like uncharacterized protein